METGFHAPAEWHRMATLVVLLSPTRGMPGRPNCALAGDGTVCRKRAAATSRLNVGMRIEIIPIGCNAGYRRQAKLAGSVRRR